MTLPVSAGWRNRRMAALTGLLGLGMLVCVALVQVVGPTERALRPCVDETDVLSPHRPEICDRFDTIAGRSWPLASWESARAAQLAGMEHTPTPPYDILESIDAPTNTAFREMALAVDASPRSDRWERDAAFEQARLEWVTLELIRRRSYDLRLAAALEEGIRSDWLGLARILPILGWIGLLALPLLWLALGARLLGRREVRVRVDRSGVTLDGVRHPHVAVRTLALVDGRLVLETDGVGVRSAPLDPDALAIARAVIDAFEGRTEPGAPDEVPAALDALVGGTGRTRTRVGAPQADDPGRPR